MIMRNKTISLGIPQNISLRGHSNAFISLSDKDIQHGKYVCRE